MVAVRAAIKADAAQVWKILEPVIRAGDTYTLPKDMTEEQAIAYWFSPTHRVFVALDEAGTILGTYYIRPNQQGGGSHVCNCGYMTSQAAMGRGVASTMCQHSLDQARSMGFRAMQYNFVVSTNPAVRLWKKFGFDIVGTLPGAFHHPQQGYVDAYVMFSKL
jgi:L-amino acid N-acyltransferase YncA